MCLYAMTQIQFRWMYHYYAGYDSSKCETSLQKKIITLSLQNKLNHWHTIILYYYILYYILYCIICDYIQSHLASYSLIYFIVKCEKVKNNFIGINIDCPCLSSGCWPRIITRKINYIIVRKKFFDPSLRGINQCSCICAFLALLKSCLLSNPTTTFHHVFLK